MVTGHLATKPYKKCKIKILSLLREKYICNVYAVQYGDMATYICQHTYVYICMWQHTYVSACVWD